MPCNCIQHFYRKGRADLRCVECDRDITMEIVFMSEIGVYVHPTHRKTDEGFLPIE